VLSTLPSDHLTNNPTQNTTQFNAPPRASPHSHSARQDLNVVRADSLAHISAPYTRISCCLSQTSHLLSTTRTFSSLPAPPRQQQCNVIEAPWLVNGGHGASLRHHTFQRRHELAHLVADVCLVGVENEQDQIAAVGEPLDDLRAPATRAV
jgi:hypothetical protein